MTLRPSVLCFGEALWDVLPDRRLPGGAPMNVAIRLAQYGIDTRLLSRVGRDADGDALLDYLKRVGLPPQHVQRDDREPTGTVLVDTSNPDSVRYTINRPAAWDFIDAGQYLQASGNGIDVLVFGSLAARHEVSRQSLLTLMDGARLRVLDVNLRPPFDDAGIVRMLLERADWAKVNDEELRIVAPEALSGMQVEELARVVQASYGLASLCVTLGGEGALLLVGEDTYRQKAYDVRVVDTVGCGDAFLATWLAGMLEQLAPAEALERAAAVAALVASSEGATQVFDAGDVRELVESQRAR